VGVLIGGFIVIGPLYSYPLTLSRYPETFSEFLDMILNTIFILTKLCKVGEAMPKNGEQFLHLLRCFVFRLLPTEQL
jgi:hypothetical protein